MTRLLRLFALSVLTASAVAVAQTPDAKPADMPPSQQHPSMPAPSNLQVLPKGMTAEQVHSIMHHWSGDLGVHCNYCHATDSATGHLNFASDANPMKDRARIMAKMNHTINTDYLAQLTNPAPEHDVNCGTCHRGMAKPAVFTPPAEEKHEEKH